MSKDAMSNGRIVYGTEQPGLYVWGHSGRGHFPTSLTGPGEAVKRDRWSGMWRKIVGRRPGNEENAEKLQYSNSDHEV